MDILKAITSASNDTRIDYAVIFEQGELDWYNIKQAPSFASVASFGKSSHLKHAKTMANINFKRRKSGNISKISSRSSLKASTMSTRHIKKPKSYDFGKKDLSKDLQPSSKSRGGASPKSPYNNDDQKDDLLISPVPFRKRSSNSNRHQRVSNKGNTSSKSNKRGSQTPQTSQQNKRTSIPPTTGQLQIGKITFGTSKLGLTRRVIECDENTFIDVDFVPS